MLRLLIATGNAGKVREFRDLLQTRGVACTDLSVHPAVPAPEETGHTFRANAMLKATYYATALNTWALADDSGLSADALDGAPGVHSARWADLHGAGRGDADNNALLLRQLQSVPDDRRTARFVCVLAVSDPLGRVVLTACDEVEGVLLHAPRGEGGFGYDPLFLVPELGRTTAELPAHEKHAISHRGKALRRLTNMLDALQIARRAFGLTSGRVA
ncbi:MAG TPA: RdgB/HAM1 family non-canonical purine NTP pyrophosphatase [Tepidisphaeraceae bacterium]|nr:RdgB/HAM1 family non-canonical purine NTP pyrophosphatase [Tepidisphaeraceae bacterium]